MEPPAPANRFELANRLFSDALDLPAPQRTAFVRDRCADDAALGNSVLHLLSQFERLGDFLEAPAFVPGQPPGSEFVPGELLGGRFRVTAFVGRGGMGEVYKVEDAELRETVALKTLTPRLRSEESVAARFRDEIRLARKVAHPNVCRIFDLFVEHRGGQEIPYFTMEFLEGDTLARRMAGGPLTPERALGIARQIAAGLAAAHLIGIVHRDLKPANILMVPERDGSERAVIMDFGLAKALDTAGANTGPTLTGQIVGTPDYMAPEQFLDGPATAATDIFAFAVILYEMLTGHRPFPQENAVRSAIRRMTEAPEPLERGAPSAPAGWGAAIARALSAAPEKRQQSVSELMQALEAGGSTLRTRVSVPRIPRRALLYSGVAAVPVACYLGFLRLRNRVLPDAPVIMLTPLIAPNGSADAPALGLQIERGLLQSAHVRLVTPERFPAVWKLMSANPLPPLLDGRAGPQSATAAEIQARDRAAREIALRMGAHFVLFGELNRGSEEWGLKVRLELMSNSPEHPKDEFSTRFYADTEQALLKTAAKTVSWIRRTAGESAEEVNLRSRAPEEVTTASWDALKEFTAAEDARRAVADDRRWPPDQRRGAEAHLQRALQIDPDFALAAARLADIQVAFNEFDTGMTNYERAAEIIDRRNLTDREALLIRGLFALDTGQYAKAEEVFTRYAVESPREGLPLFHKARAVECQGRLEESLRLLDAAVEREPDSYSFVLNRGIRFLIAGKLAEAERDCDRAAKRNPGDWTDHLRAGLALARSDAPGAWAALERMRMGGSLFFRSRAFTFESCWRAEQGAWSDAEALLRQGIRFDQENDQPPQVRLGKKRMLAQLFLRQLRGREAIDACREILTENPEIRTTLEVGAILAQAGDKEAARGCVPAGLPKDPPDRAPVSVPGGARKELMEWPIYWRRILRLWAELAMADGMPRVAFDLLLTAPPPEALMEWPDALVRASVACGEKSTAAGLLQKLRANPAAYWHVTDISGPAFIREAAGLASRLGQPGNEWAALLKRFGKSN